MVPLAKEVLYVESIDTASTFLLVGDIGGTNSNFGIFDIKKESPILVLSLHYKSKDVLDFTALMKQLVDYLKDHYTITCTRACIGAAGIVYPQRVTAQPTNLHIEINTHAIEKATGLKSVFLINDFEAVALGLELLPAHDIIRINQGVHRQHGNMSFLGAGTGLGKSIMVWDRGIKRYLPVASEGGHADAALMGEFEFAFSQFIYDTSITCPVSWEMVLSGKGIQMIYRFLGTRKQYPITESSREIELHDFNPDKISHYAKLDERCKDTFDLYIRFYARCAKDFALEVLSLNGLYIAGGIAAKNSAMFLDPQFMEEFRKCGAQSRRLATVPIFIIGNYNVSLYGGVVAAQLRDRGLI